MRSEIQPETSRLTMPAGQHQRQHLRAARGAEAEVAAVGDDVHLRHRHRHAAGDAGDAQQRLGRVHRRPNGRSVGVRGAGAAPRPRPAPAAGRAATARAAASSRRRRCPCRCRSGASRRVDEVLHDRRPDRAGEVVAAHADGQRDAAAAVEPQRGVGDQRREGRRAAEQAEQQAVRERESRGWAPGRRAMKPAPRPTAPTSIGSITPQRSASRPIRMPPTPKPIIGSV